MRNKKEILDAAELVSVKIEAFSLLEVLIDIRDILATIRPYSWPDEGSDIRFTAGANRFADDNCPPEE